MARKCVCLALLVNALTHAGLCADRDLAEELGSYLGGVRMGGSPGTWCEFVEAGLMTIPTTLVIDTYGVIRAVIKEHGGRETPGGSDVLVPVERL